MSGSAPRYLVSLDHLAHLHGFVAATVMLIESSDVVCQFSILFSNICYFCFELILYGLYYSSMILLSLAFIAVI